jgi:hypothetical protein
MYASDLTHKKRAEAVFRNLQLQKDWFATGQTIRILGQKGGNDYSYMTYVEEGCIADKCWKLYVPKNKIIGNGPVSDTSADMTKINFTDPGIYDIGYTAAAAASFQYLDDAFIQIPMGGMDFFFNGVNYGSQTKWNSNNFLAFGPSTDGIPVNRSVNLEPNVSKAIMLGNYDRLCSSVYYSNYNINNFSITKLIVTFSDYYTKTSNVELLAGKLQIRLIREDGGEQRQWVEVGVISAPPSPGYSNNPTMRYPLGSSTVTDTNSNPINSLKNSPWDISDGSRYLQVAASSYSTAFPSAGTTILYESDKRGMVWTFTPNAYLPI